MAPGHESFALIRIRNYLRDRLLEGLEGTDVKTGHVPFLIMVLEEPGISLTDLTRRTGLDKSTVARNVQQLSDLGYVERVGDPRRSNTVFLTDRGREMAELVLELDTAAYGDLLGCLEPEEAEDLARILSKVMGFVGDRGY